MPMIWIVDVVCTAVAECLDRMDLSRLKGGKNENVQKKRL